MMSKIGVWVFLCLGESPFHNKVLFMDSSLDSLCGFLVRLIKGTKLVQLLSLSFFSHLSHFLLR